jgi:hypothetical protein
MLRASNLTYVQDHVVSLLGDLPDTSIAKEDLRQDIEKLTMCIADFLLLSTSEMSLFVNNYSTLEKIGKEIEELQ